MKDIIILVLTTIFTLSVLLYSYSNNKSYVTAVDKQVLDLSIPISGTIDTEYLKNNINLPR